MIAIMTNKESKTRATVTTINYVPFHPEHGLGMTEEDLRNSEIWSLVEDIGEPENNGKTPILYHNETEGVIWYEYVERPLSEEERAEARIVALEEMTGELMMELAMLKGVL